MALVDNCLKKAQEHVSEKCHAWRKTQKFNAVSGLGIGS
jgi:hypothetical protein